MTSWNHARFKGNAVSFCCSHQEGVNDYFQFLGVIKASGVRVLDFSIDENDNVVLALSGDIEGLVRNMQAARPKSPGISSEAKELRV